MRKIIFNYLPDFVHKRNFEKMQRYRPIANFLPAVAFRGSGAVLPQILSAKYQKEQANKSKNESAALMTVSV